MENKCKRFLSLLLALVMVFGLMPMGQVRAEERAAFTDLDLNTPSVNLAFGKRVVASDCEDNTEYTADKVVDGDLTSTGSRWATNKSTAIEDRSIQIDLGSEQVIGRIEIYFQRTDANQNILRYAVKVSKDAAVWEQFDSDAWETVYEKDEKAAQHETVELGAKTARYVMLTVENYDGGLDPVWENVSVREIEVYAPDLTMNVGDTATIEVDGDYSNVLGNETVSVRAECVADTVKQVGPTPATQIESGATYVITTGRKDRTVRTMVPNAVSNSDGSKTGIELVGAVCDESAYWVITQVDGGYTISSANGNVQPIQNDKATLAQDAVVQIRQSENNDYGKGYFEIYTTSSNGTKYYLNYFDSFAGITNSECAASAYDNNDAGSQWRLYKVEDVVADKYIASWPVTAIRDGGSYVFTNDRAFRDNKPNTLMSSNDANDLVFAGTTTNFDDYSIWTVTSTTGGYNVKNQGNGKYMSIGSGTGEVNDTANLITITASTSCTSSFRIAQGGQYANNWGNDAEEVNGYDAVNDQNSQWFVHEVLAPSANTIITITAARGGDTTVTIGDDIYSIHVHGWVNADCDTPKTCSGCGATEGAAKGHTWVDADCDTPKTCSVCQATEGAALGHKWQSDGTCGNAGCTERWGYTNMTMGNDLEVHFAFRKDLVADWSNHYAVIEKDYADDRETDPQIVELGDWKTAEIYGDDHYYVTFTGVAAKEMTDEFHVTIYDADGQPVNVTYTDTIKAYAHRNLDGNNEDYKTVMVDMLNYGAEAQTALGYNEGNLANADLPDDQKDDFAGVALPGTEEKEAAKTGDFQYKANVNMDSNIQFMMAFAGIEAPTQALVTVTHWNGATESITIEDEGFGESTGYYYFTIDKTVVADARQTITCVLKDAEGGVIVTVEDSIAQYAARAVESYADNADNADNADLYKAIVKFSDSAKAYLESANPA